MLAGTHPLVVIIIVFHCPWGISVYLPIFCWWLEEDKGGWVNLFCITQIDHGSILLKCLDMTRWALATGDDVSLCWCCCYFLLGWYARRQGLVRLENNLQDMLMFDVDQMIDWWCDYFTCCSGCWVYVLRRKLRFFVGWTSVRAKETKERWRLSFISMLCLISACVTVVASLLVGMNPWWVAVFDNLVNNSKMRGKIIMWTVVNSELWNIFKKNLIRFVCVCDVDSLCVWWTEKQ